MDVIKRANGRVVEVRAMRESDTVIVHLPGQRELIIESDTFSDMVQATVVWRGSSEPITVYDAKGEEIVTLRPR